MIGLKGHKQNRKSKEFIFSLEEDLKKEANYLEVRKKIEEKIHKLKDYLRTGENQQDFDYFGVLMHGYTSLLRVVSRFSPK